MQIANPIYDVVFKFMMEDKKIAKSFISAIIDEKVLELDFAAQERTLRRTPEPKTTEDEPEKLFLTVCRFDFSAKILTHDGSVKTVMIELQKAKMASDIMRFRRYIGSHYQNSSNTYGDEQALKACPIYGIFLLGYDIGIDGHPIIHVNYNCEDSTTKQKIDIDNEFIQSLHHQSWIVQINQLKQYYRNDLEKLLGIFDQSDHIYNQHILKIDEREFPEIYQPIIRRLHMASESEDIQIEMELEDDYMKELQDKERYIAEQKQTIAESKKTIEAKDKALEAKDKALEAKDKTIEAKDKTIDENKKTIEAKDKTIVEKDKLIEELKKQLAESPISSKTKKK
ncbi:MAG: hypothetical protein LBH59_05980 [Planctomycetaceae bacterium]|jgi:hypothetical protein|nr:hypothetical protein [Planctomycetaceae bacterium]